MIKHEDYVTKSNKCNNKCKCKSDIIKEKKKKKRKIRDHIIKEITKKSSKKNIDSLKKLTDDLDLIDSFNECGDNDAVNFSQVSLGNDHTCVFA